MNCSSCVGYYPGCDPRDCYLEQLKGNIETSYKEIDFRPKFNRISTCPDAILPIRATELSAGYDFFSSESRIIDPFEVVLIPTGVKVKLPFDKYLQISIRSSVAIKRTLIIPNAPAVIDADYYDNEANEGHIMVPILNLSSSSQTIEKHSRIAQGVILRYFKTSDDHAMAVRSGGMGSTGG